MKLFLILFLFLTLLGPVWQLLSGNINLHSDWRTANRSSAHLAPDPKTFKDAIIQVYSAPAFNWRRIFSTHTWIAVKEEGASNYTVYQVIGWRVYALLPPLVNDHDIPDRYWFNEKPKVILDIRGDTAKALIPKIQDAASRYPYAKEYDLWPGPNSNTFTAYIAREVPELRLVMPSNAIGKDYLGEKMFARVPSGTGYQFSLLGVFGITLALREGVEFNFLGAVYGISPSQRVVKLPGFGDIGLACFCKREVRWEYPLDAIREAVSNILCHRDYTSAAHSQIRLYDDKLEMWNAGGLPSSLTPELLFGEHDSIPRNRKIAEAFYYMGYIERWGTGTTRMVAELQAANLPPPEFNPEPGRFRLVFYKQPFSEENLKKMDLSDRQIQAVAYVKSHGSISNAEYQGLTGISKRTATRELNDLTLKNIFMTEGGSRGRGKHYRLRE